MQEVALNDLLPNVQQRLRSKMTPISGVFLMKFPRQFGHHQVIAPFCSAKDY
jgi:hypothetical protein